MILSPTQKGMVSEQFAIAALLNKGYDVLVPINPMLRYDLIYVKDGKYIRAQVKTGKLGRNRSIEFHCRAVSAKHGKHTYTKIDIDEYLVVFNKEVYMVPVEQAGVESCSLRLAVGNNNQIKGIRFAEEYLL